MISALHGRKDSKTDLVKVLLRSAPLEKARVTNGEMVLIHLGIMARKSANGWTLKSCLGMLNSVHMVEICGIRRSTVLGKGCSTP